MVDVERADTSQASQDVDMSIDVDSSQREQIIPDIDPITKQKLERPVRNKHCNHIYGFNSVQQSIQQSGRLRYDSILFISDYLLQNDLIFFLFCNAQLSNRWMPQ